MANENTPKATGIDAITTPGEVLVFQTGKHPLGIIYTFLQAIFGFALASGLLLFLVPEFVSEDMRASVVSTLVLILAIASLCIGGVLLIAAYLYNQSKLIVTNKNMTQVMQYGLFSRKVSELSLGSIEDVTAEKNGIMASIFDYGVLRIETAGEQNNFHFTYCPHPNKYGQQLLDARQHYHDTHGDFAV